MKKLYRKGTIHPTKSDVSDHLLSFLPAAVLALTVALSPSDREVLAYLVSCSSSPTTPSTRRKRSDDHAPSFGCSCFGCYISYWVRWDASPNRQLIHEVIDAYEEDNTLLNKGRSQQHLLTCSKRRRGKKVNTIGYSSNDADRELSEGFSGGAAVVLSRNERVDDVAIGSDIAVASEAAVAQEKGSVGRFVSFLGQSLWGGVWG